MSSGPDLLNNNNTTHLHDSLYIKEKNQDFAKLHSVKRQVISQEAEQLVYLFLSPCSAFFHLEEDFWSENFHRSIQSNSDNM